MEKLKVKPVMLPITGAVKKGQVEAISNFYNIGGTKSISICKNEEIDNILVNAKELVVQHLYLVSQREIKEGDWFKKIDGGIYQAQMVDNNIFTKNVGYFGKYECQKIEATTDRSLNLPLIPQSFVEEYVSKQGKIDEVWIEMADDVLFAPNKFGKDAETECGVKLNSNGTVIIHPVKESWTKEEVIHLLIKFGEHVSEKCIGKKLQMIGELYKWIPENL